MYAYYAILCYSVLHNLKHINYSKHIPKINNLTLGQIWFTTFLV